MRTTCMTLALASALLALGLLACGRQTPEANAQGNDAFDAQDYAGAGEAYQRAQESSPDLPEPFYNSGNSQYRQESYDDALSSYDQAQLNAGEGLTGSIHFNRGNLHFNREAYGEAAEAYKEVLRLNPDNEDAKRNLELALRHMQQEQEQQEQKQQGQQEQQEEQQQQGETKGEQEQQQAGEQEQEEDQEQDSQDGQDEQEQPEAEQDGEQEEQDGQQQPQPGPGGQQPPPLTEEQARQLLEAVGSDAQTLQEHLQRQQAPSGPPPEPDW